MGADICLFGNSTIQHLTNLPAFAKMTDKSIVPPSPSAGLTNFPVTVLF
jgi:hypothetical protein